MGVPDRVRYARPRYEGRLVFCEIKGTLDLGLIEGARIKTLKHGNKLLKAADLTVLKPQEVANQVYKIK